MLDPCQAKFDSGVAQFWELGDDVLFCVQAMGVEAVLGVGDKVEPKGRTKMVVRTPGRE